VVIVLAALTVLQDDFKYTLNDDYRNCSPQEDRQSHFCKKVLPVVLNLSLFTIYLNTMKTILFSITVSTLFVAACNNDSPKDQASEKPSSDSTVQAGIKDRAATTGTSIDGLLNDYMRVKNALTKDNDKDAAAAGNAMAKTFASFDKTSLTAEQAKMYNDIEEDAKEHAQHIGSNAGNIKHQREHFETLSQEMYELVKTFGAGQKVYYTNCPMYNDNKGANWLSETKEIRNPYLGQSMPTCGSVKEELN